MSDRSSRSLPRSSPPATRARLALGGAETPDEYAMATLLARLPAVEADDRAVGRVWRQMMTPPTPVPWISSWARWLAPALAVAAAMMGVLFVLPGTRWGAAPSVAELVVSSGGVFSPVKTGAWQASQNGEVLTETGELRTDATGRAVVRIPGVSALLLGPDTEVRLERLVHGTVLRLLRGTLTARVSKRPPDEPFIVATARYSVKVVGTLFTVVAGPLDRTQVSVREGVVDVSSGHSPIYRVPAGARWSSDAPDAATADRTADTVATLLEDGLRGVPGADLMGELTALAPTSPGAAGPRGQRAVAPTLPSRPEALQESPAVALLSPSSKPFISAPTEPAREVSAPPPAPAPPSPGAVEAGDAGSPERLPATPTSPLAPSATPEGPVVAGPYAYGLALEASGDVEGAARELSKAADSDQVHGDLALYSLGRLAERRLHDAGRALAAFRRYRAEYPRGALLPEVDFEIVKLDVEARDRAGTLAETVRFLTQHPASDRVPEVRFLRANALRDEGRCVEALPDYALVVTVPTLADDALYSTAYCQRNLGDRAAAGRTLAEYLRRFPEGVHRADAERAIHSEHEIEN